jgi:hypothetical protein
MLLSGFACFFSLTQAAPRLADGQLLIFLMERMLARV